ncbi:helix-turn-helix transcriptional regulator [Amnibacterium sp. CER49]|uniref:helix-turn-helix transcriptional regulator n=1 Tax=Amnibacterium sp. CER49 TaxID=3039161 RepID=UPI00244C5D92|nr:helix-turn-helix transcriptional regulator [Amnibacterium sp. CER49]MDH2443809.1 helix-turn-helix transcriptional regulator [Amnibacterium sp. CER49]
MDLRAVRDVVPPGERDIAIHAEAELAWLASTAGPLADRAHGMLLALGQLVPFDAAWIAGLDGNRYVSLASTGLDDGIVDYLSGPRMAHDIALTGVNRHQPPLSVSDLTYPASELRTWSECLLPAGLGEALSVALFEPGGRHIGFLTVLSVDPEPPAAAARIALASVSELLAHGIDPLTSLTAASRLVGDAFAGVLLLDHERTEALPGLPGHELLAAHSAILDTVRARLLSQEMHLTFLWPHTAHDGSTGHVRATYLTVTSAPFPSLVGVVLLSPAGPLHGLTARELEVLGMMVDGFSNQQIARQLVVTARTVATHVEHILAKLGSPTRTHAAVHAQREGLYVPPTARG